MTDKKTIIPEDNKNLSSRRKFLKKASYVPPTMIALGTLTSLKTGAAQSCETHPKGCPPNPP